MAALGGPLKACFDLTLAERRFLLGLLLLFCLVTYAIAPVAGFGWLLLIMGLCLSRPEQRWLRGAYVTTFFVVLLVTEIPWASVLLDGARWLGLAA